MIHHYFFVREGESNMMFHNLVKCLVLLLMTWVGAIDSATITSSEVFYVDKPNDMLDLDQPLEEKRDIVLRVSLAS